MLARSIFAASRPALFLVALAGCAEATPASDAPSASTDAKDTSADFEVAELKSFSAKPRSASCDLSAKCVREAGAKATESCAEQAKACLKDTASQTKGVLGAFAECRQTAAECGKDDTSRDECKAEFTACVKAAFEGAAKASPQKP